MYMVVKAVFKSLLANGWGIKRNGEILLYKLIFIIMRVGADAKDMLAVVKIIYYFIIAFYKRREIQIAVLMRTDPLAILAE